MDPHIHEEVPSVSSGAIIGFVIAAILVLLIIVDVICFCVARAGILALLCNRGKSQDDEDPKLGRYVVKEKKNRHSHTKHNLLFIVLLNCNTVQHELEILVYTVGDFRCLIAVTRLRRPIRTV